MVPFAVSNAVTVSTGPFAAWPPAITMVLPAAETAGYRTPFGKRPTIRNVVPSVVA